MPLAAQLPNGTASGLRPRVLVVEDSDGPAAVVVTGTASEEVIVGAMRRGAVDYVVKGGE